MGFNDLLPSPPWHLPPRCLLRACIFWSRAGNRPSLPLSGSLLKRSKSATSKIFETCQTCTLPFSGYVDGMAEAMHGLLDDHEILYKQMISGSVHKSHPSGPAVVASTGEWGSDGRRWWRSEMVVFSGWDFNQGPNKTANIL